jgi:hypothetical protein
MFVESPTLYASTFSFAGEEKVVKVVTAPLGIFGGVPFCAAARAATSVYCLFIQRKRKRASVKSVLQNQYSRSNDTEITKRDAHQTDDDEVSRI